MRRIQPSWRKVRGRSARDWALKGLPGDQAHPRILGLGLFCLGEGGGGECYHHSHGGRGARALPKQSLRWAGSLVTLP